MFSCAFYFLADRLRRSELSYRLARGMFWSLVGTVVARGAMLVASILVARLLGREVYGQLGIFQSTIGMFGVFSGFGLGMTTARYVAGLRQRDPEKAGRIISLTSSLAIFTGIVVGLAILVAAPWISAAVLKAPELGDYLRAGIPFLWLSTINGAQIGALSGLEAFRQKACVNFIVGIITFPVMVFLTRLWDLWGTIAALNGLILLNVVGHNIVLRAVLRQYGIPLGYRGMLHERQVIWRFSLPSALASSLVMPVQWICNVLLVNQPGGYGEMGIYNAVIQWRTALLFLPTLLGHVLVPIMAERLGADDPHSSRKALRYGIIINGVTVLPFAVIIGVASPWIMRAYGKGFAGSWPALLTMMGVIGLLAMQLPAGHMITASGRMWLGFAMNLGWAIAAILFTIFFVELGALGLAIAQLLSYMLHSLWTFGYIYYQIRNPKKTNGKTS